MSVWHPLGALAEGGMGRLVRVRHRETGRIAVQKTVRTHDAAQRAAIRREIRALAAVEHPGVARILDEGEQEDGAWYAMPLIEGPTLAEAWKTPDAATGDAVTGDVTLSLAWDAPAPTPVRSGRADWARWRTTLAVLAETLAHIHAQGLVHGDLKPDNVLLPSPDRPVLVDFGLTSRLGARENIDRLVSVTAPLGTPAYMAPERCAGAPFDIRADLYALGCMLYELFAGCPPFTGTAGEVLRAHRSRSPYPIDERVSGIPAELAALVTALLQKDPRDRPSNTLEVARTLRGADGHAVPPEQDREGGLERIPVLFQPRLAGREALLERVETARVAAGQGEGSAVVLSGEGGVGKTRLAMEVLARAHSAGFRVVSGQCVPLDGVGAPPLSTVSEAVRTAVRLARSEGLERTHRLFGRRARVLHPWFPEVADIPGFASQPARPSVPPEVGRPLLIDALASLVVGLADRPMVFFVDDLQWADGLALALLRQLSDQAVDQPLLVLATARPEADIPDGFTTLPLGPLDGEAARRIVADMLGTEPSAALLEHVVRVSEGSPFLLTEAVRAARDAVDLAQVTDARSLARLRVGVDGERRAVLESALVLGPRATVGRMAALEQRTPDEVLDATHALERADLLFTALDGRVFFAHAHLRDAVSDQLPGERTSAMHLRAATLLEDDDAAGAHEVADHLFLGGRPDQARPLYLDAARELLGRYAPEGAERWLRRAAETESPDATVTEAALELARSVLIPLGRAEEARRAVRPHLELVDALDDPGLSARVRLSLGASHRILGDYDASRQMAEEARTIAREHGDVNHQADALAELASLGTVTNDLEQAVQLCRRARALQPRGVAVHRLLKAEALALWHLNRAEEAVQVAQELVNFAVRGSRYEQAEALYTLGLIQGETEALDQSWQNLERAAEDFEALGARRMVALCKGNLAGVACQEERFGDAVLPLVQSRDTLRSLGDTRSSALTALNLAYVYEALDRPGAAAETYAEGADALERLGDTQLPRAIVGLARTSRLNGADIGELEAILSRASGTPASPSLRLLLSTERVWLAVQRGEDVDAALAAMEQLYAEVGSTAYADDAVREARAAAKRGPPTST